MKRNKVKLNENCREKMVLTKMRILNWMLNDYFSFLVIVFVVFDPRNDNEKKSGVENGKLKIDKSIV